MLLEEFGLRKTEITKLNKRNINTVEDVQNFFPRAYYDFTEIKAMHPSLNGQFVAIMGKFIRMETQKTNETLMLKAKILENSSDKKLHVMWIGNYHLKNLIKDWIDMDVIVCGKLTYEDRYHSFHILNPLVFSTDIKSNMRVFPVYTKMSGISEEWMSKLIKNSLECKIDDKLPEDLRKKWKLMSLREAVVSMHEPKSMEQLKRAERRIIFDSLYSFASSIIKKDMEVSKGSVYNIKSLDLVNSFAKSLPFNLTQSQKDAFNEMRTLAAEGRRVNALVQGDVGSGKTMVAFLMMFAMAADIRACSWHRQRYLQNSITKNLKDMQIIWA